MYPAAPNSPDLKVIVRLFSALRKKVDELSVLITKVHGAVSDGAQNRKWFNSENGGLHAEKTGNVRKNKERPTDCWYKRIS